MSTHRELISKKNIIIVGDFGTGKTSLLHRFIKKEFSKVFINTSLDFYSHELKYKEDILPVFIWDSLGHERFQSMTDSFYKKADGVVLVFDLTDDSNSTSVNNWIRTISENCSANIPIIVVGNKRDICSIHERKIKEVSKEVGKSQSIIDFVTASARNGENVDELFRKIIISVFEEMMANERPENKEAGVIQPEEAKSSECCRLL